MASSSPQGPKSRSIDRLRHLFAFNLGVTQSRKIAIYEDLLKSVSLLDLSYWLQVLFSAGIATLGLVLDSPAVIIGAMLISPLMGPILANGMAFAVGDLILAARALLCLNLSSIVAVLFSSFLIAVLPFKEATAEISSRIEPNLLDLTVALFSGALGAVATTKKADGVVTSIPGVAIAVALMPPLCVVGFGMGRSLSVGSGLNFAWGGGLLFVTNLTAITLMAMLVFQMIRVDVPSIKRKAEEWHSNDPESRWMRRFFDNLPGINRVEVIGSWRNRLIVVLLPIFMLLIPLSQSFVQLQSEFNSRQRQNEVEKIWRDDFATDDNDNPRAYIDSFEFTETANKLLLQIRVFTSEGFTDQEKSRFIRRVANQLNLDRDNIQLNLIQIPTSQVQLETQLIDSEPDVERVLSVAELQAELWGQIDVVLGSVPLTQDHQLLNYGVVLSKEQPLAVNIEYLSDRDIQQDGKDLLAETVKQRLSLDETQVTFVWINSNAGEMLFEPGSVDLTTNAEDLLDRVAMLLAQYPQLKLELQAQGVADETIPSNDNPFDSDNINPFDGLLSEDLRPETTISDRTELNALILDGFGSESTLTLADQRIKAIQAYLSSSRDVEAQRVQFVSVVKVIDSNRPKLILTLTLQ